MSFPAVARRCGWALAVLMPLSAAPLSAVIPAAEGAVSSAAVRPLEPNATQSSPAIALAQPRTVEKFGLDDLSPGFLGIYRKVMEIEEPIRTYAESYRVDLILARAVCMYESGGNANLTSEAGAHGYFQVMPRTERLLGVDTNIEAGIKYLSQMIARFEREDYALAAYNGGPTAVGRRRPMRLESLQYVLGVGQFRTLLKLYEPTIRRHAGQLRLERVNEGDSWWSLAQRLGSSVLQLRLHNPYLSHRGLRAGDLVAYPVAPRPDLFSVAGTSLEYRSRIGDNYFNLAFAFEVELDKLRQVNDLWHLQTLPVGMVVRVPLAWEGEHTDHLVAPGESLPQIAQAVHTSAWRLIRDNSLWDQQVASGTLLRVRQDPLEPRYARHRVRAGDTLTAIASRYGTSIRDIQDANRMGRRTTIRIGERLLVPDHRGR
ncbi:MAG: LysM peptidoglycan-binding domain-containing protein [Acidobacteriota bacterium]